MRREISTAATMFYQISILIFAGIALPLSFFSNVNNFSIANLTFALVLVLITFTAIQKTLKLKKVEMTDTGLFISRVSFGRKNEIFVPFEKIKNVRRSFWAGNTLENIIVDFMDPARFGGKITFAGKFRFLSFGKHPIIEELNRKIRDAQFEASLKRQNP